MPRMRFDDHFMFELHVYLLLAFCNHLNLSEAQNLLDDQLYKRYHLGRKIIPYTQELLDWGFLERTNPGAPRVSGYMHLTTPKGREAIDQWFETLKSVSTAIEKGYIL